MVGASLSIPVYTFGVGFDLFLNSVEKDGSNLLVGEELCGYYNVTDSSKQRGRLVDVSHC